MNGQPKKQSEPQWHVEYAFMNGPQLPHPKLAHQMMKAQTYVVRSPHVDWLAKTWSL